MPQTSLNFEHCEPHIFTFPTVTILKTFPQLSCQHGILPHLRGLLWAVLEQCVKDLHVVGVPGIGQLVEDHQLHHGSQVVFVCIQ